MQVSFGMVTLDFINVDISNRDLRFGGLCGGARGHCASLASHWGGAFKGTTPMVEPSLAKGALVPGRGKGGWMG